MMMPIQITGKHLSLTPTLKSDVNKKFQKLERHFPQMTGIHVTLSLEKVDHREQHLAKAHITLPRGDIIAEESSDDMYASIDVLVDKLDKQLIKHKEKMKEDRGEELF